MNQPTRFSPVPQTLRRMRWIVRLYHIMRQPGMLPRNASLRWHNHREGGLPIPPSRLIFAVQGSEDLQAFLSTGSDAARNIREVMDRQKVQLEGLDAILDFGCGAGRVLRHWHALRGPEVHGMDIHPGFVEWCRRNLPFACFEVNQLRQRTSYSDGKFDLIYAFSVFTHLSQEGQFFWIREMTRVLKPGGYLILSTHGDIYITRYVAPEDHPRYRLGELIVYGEESEGSNLCLAYHPFQYVRDKLAAHLSLLEYLPNGAAGNPAQDEYLFQKPVN